MGNTAANGRFILTGAPGSGKTSVLAALAGLGYQVVTEAATDVIAAQQAMGTGEPWRDPGFIDQIVALQRSRQAESDRTAAGVRICDRSPVCTLALARYLGWTVSDALAAEIARITREDVYQRTVFFVRPIGFVRPTAARRISYQESLAFERVHVAAYVGLGYTLVDVPAAEVAERAAMIAAHIRGGDAGPV